MATAQTTPKLDTTEQNPAAEAPTDEPVVEEILVEEVSIDGMCGVY